MSNTIYRVMGKRGRITIPYDFRQQVGFGYNDILATIEKFKQNHGYEFEPLTDYDRKELSTSSVSTPAGTTTTLVKRGTGEPTKAVTVKSPEPMDADVAQAMSLLKDCILQG